MDTSESNTLSTSDEQRAPDDFFEYWLNDEKEELEKTSTPSAPGDIDVSGGGTDTEKAESASNGIISRLKSTVSTVTRKVSGALSNISPHCHDDVTKILPSNDTNQSTDTEEVEGSLNPDSSGAIGTPPELKVVRTGGRKRKGGARKRRNSKKTATKNNNCRGGARTYHTPLGNGEERRECLERVLLNAVGTGGNEEGTQTIIAMQLGVTHPSKPKQKN